MPELHRRLFLLRQSGVPRPDRAWHHVEIATGTAHARPRVWIALPVCWSGLRPATRSVYRAKA